MHAQYVHVTCDICVCVQLSLNIHTWIQVNIQISIQIHSSLYIVHACIHLCDRGVLEYLHGSLHGSLPHDSRIAYILFTCYSADLGDHNFTEVIEMQFPAGKTSASVVIAIDDDVYEETESFQVAINSTSDDDVLIGINNEITVNIEDDEMMTVFFQEDSYSFSERDGEAVVTVYADLPSGGLAVNITLGVNITNGTAEST